MDATENYKHIGKIMDAHGIRGELYALVFSGDVSWIRQLKDLRLVRSGETETFEIKRIKEFKRGFIVALKDFDNRNRAEEFKGAEIWVPAEVFVSKHGEALYLSEILNFKIEDELLGEIGVIKSFSSNGVQDLLVVENGESEIEIPFVKDFVKSIDFKTKKMKTVLPEGLLEINEADED
ncbi:MAG: ribosome maturation factor RimM [Pseudobdellovibrio sp.]